MRLDATLAGLLSNLFLDIAKAYFIATLVTPPIIGVSSIGELLLILTKGILTGMLFMFASWYFARRKENS